MKRFGVYNYHTKEFLGDFLSISDDYHNGVKIWHLDIDGELTYSYKEDIIIKEMSREEEC